MAEQLSGETGPELRLDAAFEDDMHSARGGTRMNPIRFAAV